MSIYTLTDPETRFIAAAMRRCGGRWNGVRNVWMFGSVAGAADAALELYGATRATLAMREQLQSVIDDGTAVAAWNYDETQPIDLDALSFAQAKAMQVSHQPEARARCGAARHRERVVPRPRRRKTSI